MAGDRKLPKHLTLPSGAVVQLYRDDAESDAPVSASPMRPLFHQMISTLDEGRVVIRRGGARVDVRTLVLRDFHVLRAVLTRTGILFEDDVDFRCQNCDAEIRTKPCRALEIGPWVDGELGDLELDTTLPFGVPIDVPGLRLGRGRTARSVTFEDRTVAEAMPLFDAAAEKDLRIDATIASALGIRALGDEQDPVRIADALRQCDDDAFAAVTDAFLATHYVRRLACVVFCASCGARSDVDAPYDREFAPGVGDAPSAVQAFPDFVTFASAAREIAEPMMIPPADTVEIFVEEGTPAVDDGGDPLLGSYVPPHPGDATAPSRAALVSVYYRTFRAIWTEDGPYNWEDELKETIEHELEHHVSFLRGDDPTDEEERAAIQEEAVRIIGRHEAGRREIAGFAASVRDFAVRTWPLWIIAFVAALVMLATQQ